MAMAAVAMTAGVAGGVYAAGGPSDEAALEPSRPAASKAVEKRVNALLRKMTVDEKLQQVQLLSDGQMNEEQGARGGQRQRKYAHRDRQPTTPRRPRCLPHTITPPPVVPHRRSPR